MKTVDARNIPCPGPVIKTKKALSDMSEGSLEVLVDNAIAVQNLTKLGGYLHLESTSEKAGENDYRVLFQVGGTPDLPAATTEEICIPDSRQRGTIVTLATDHMGEGDEALGKILMKGFVYALTELEDLPETILLYNAGAKLSAEGSEALPDLKLLEAQGVEILTCGTCLNHYGLSEKLAVGSVTNMYVIAEKLMGAFRVIRP
ncbi:MAG: sulfurtransferase-like selenium metabolism protein YedF [Hungatella sp.]